MTRHHLLTPGAKPAPAEPRVEEILLQARQAFVEKGFDGASMQDIARAAGMSAGNFYRYFNSKAAIVEALVARDLEEIESEFANVVGSPDPIAALRATLRRRLSQDCRDDFALWAEIVAAAARKPEIAAISARLETEITEKIVLVLSLGCGLPAALGAARFTTPARFILLLLSSLGTQNSGAAGIDPALNALVLTTIDRLIDEVTTTPAKAPQ